jgi:hypothetical protein
MTLIFSYAKTIRDNKDNGNNICFNNLTYTKNLRQMNNKYQEMEMKWLSHYQQVNKLH